MHPLLIAIRDNPLNYLPQQSLKALGAFRAGYSSRFAMEDQNVNWQYDRSEFHDWLCKKFQLKFADALADTTIVNSFFALEESAFSSYFVLLEEFLHLENRVKQSKNKIYERQNFIQMLMSIRQSPALYLGHSTFLGCCSYLRGDEQAHQDLRLPQDEGREVFRNFQEWVEQERNQGGQKRAWFKVIEFWSGGIDCGHTSSGAWSLFWKWLDQYTQSIGKEQLFGSPAGVPGSGDEK